MKTEEFKTKHPDLAKGLEAKGINFETLHTKLTAAGFNWTQVLSIIQTILAAVAPLIPSV
jgi:hypothetical protein